MSFPQTEEELNTFVTANLDADSRIQSVNQATEGDYEGSLMKRSDESMVQIRRLELTGGEGEPTVLVLDRNGLHPPDQLDTVAAFFVLDEVSEELKVKVKFSDGRYATAALALVVDS